MNKKYKLLILAFSAISAYAGPVSVEDAQETAIRFLERSMPENRQAKAKSLHADALELAYTAISAEGLNSFYVFNKSEEEGFIIVSGDDRTTPILGYAESGSFDYANLPGNFKYWLERCRNTIACLAGNPAFSPNATATDIAPMQPDAVAPLLGNIAYDQNAPYNNLCPTVAPRERAATGCSATAMAQIMKFHEHPAHGTGERTYTSRSLGLTLHADFGNTSYDWENMLDTYTQNIFKPNYNAEQAEAIATLMYQCGVAMEMDYNTSSSATDYAMLNAFATYFGYDSSTLRLLQRDFYTSTEWREIIRAELAEGYPLIYNGQSMEGGHSFVCDGYDASGLFHINWGWGGLSNGYFDLDILEPDVQGTGGSLSGFSFGQTIITGIRPAEEGQEQTSWPDLRLSALSFNRESITAGETVHALIRITNSGTGTFNGLMAFKVEPADGQEEAAYHYPDEKLSLETGSWWLTGEINCEMFPEEKEYNIYVACQNNGEEEWQVLEMPFCLPGYVKAIAKDGTVTFTTEGVPQAEVELSGFQAEGELSTGREGTFTFTLANTGSMEFNQPLYLLLEEETTFRPATQYVWMKGIYMQPGETREFTATGTITLEAGGYTAYLMTATGILGYMPVTVTDENAHLTETESQETRIYPIPTEEWLCIECGQPIQEVEIHDLSGSVVRTASPGNNNAAKIHVSTLPKGIYIAEIHTSDGTICRKIMKE